MTVTDLRQKYPVFTYQSANWQIEGDQFQASYAFSAGKYTFHHQIAFACDQKQIEKCSQSMIDQLVFSLGMVEALSYWKAFCSPIIQLEVGSLSPKQIEWWHKLLINGMGEYFYVNQIDFTAQDFVKIVASDQNSQITAATNFSSNSSRSIARDPEPQSSFLIPIGGGKDSIVTLELLKQFNAQQSLSTTQTLDSNNQPPDSVHQQLNNQTPATINQQLDNQPPNPSPLFLLLVNPTQAARDVANLANLPAIIVNRQLDPLLLDLNKHGYLNGHVPFSASLAFISVLVAYLHQIDNVALSNEASANEASLTYLNRPINHQYSKSFEFERDFRDYVGDLPTPDKQVSAIPDGTLKQVQGDSLRSSFQHDEVLPSYFSLLRPLNELQIGRLFAKIGQPYFSIFRSCNRGSKTNTWCGDCPKCLFAYLMLAPWLDESIMVNIFGQNLLEKNQLLPTIVALVGATPDKPLECIGLRDESLIACHLIAEQYKQNYQPLPSLLTLINQQIYSIEDPSTKAQALLSNWNLEHFLSSSQNSYLNLALIQSS